MIKVKQRAKSDLALAMHKIMMRVGYVKELMTDKDKAEYATILKKYNTI